MKNTSNVRSRVSHSSSSERRSWQRESRHKGRRSAFFICLLVAILQFQQGGRALPLATDALRYFNSFFITGDAVSGGAGLWNTGAGTINVGAAPAGAEALGAFLYWQVVTSADPTIVDVNAGAEFNGVPLNVPLGTQLQPTAKGVGAGDAGVFGVWRGRQSGPHVSRRCPLVSRYRPRQPVCASSTKQADTPSPFQAAADACWAPAWSSCIDLRIQQRS